ncbi:MAG: TetR/AcrR family transcriptional regulator [Reyranellaceae bacterium]
MTASPAALPTKRERNKASNRAALLVAAKAVFAEMGFGAASVRDIIRRTDLAAGTFYNYFNDKQEIFRAVVEELTTELRLEHSSGRAVAATLEDFVRGTFSAYFDFIAGDPDMVKFSRRNASAIRTLLDQPEITPLFDDLRQDLAGGMARGLVPSMDVGYLAASIAGIAFEVSMVMVARDPVDPKAATDFAANLLLNGLRGGGR